MERGAVILVGGLALAGVLVGILDTDRGADTSAAPLHPTDPAPAARAPRADSFEGRAPLLAARPADPRLAQVSPPETTPLERVEETLLLYRAWQRGGDSSREAIDRAGRHVLGELEPGDEDLLARILTHAGSPVRDRLAAADLLVLAGYSGGLRSDGGPGLPLELKAFLERVAEDPKAAWSTAGGGDGVGRAWRHQASAARRALVTLGTPADRERILDELELQRGAELEALEAGRGPDGSIPLSRFVHVRNDEHGPSALAWILGATRGDAPVTGLEARTDGPLADGALATLARWCEERDAGDLTSATRVSWRAKLADLAIGTGPGASAVDPERLRDAVDAFARLTGDASLAMPEPRSAATVRRLAARVQRRDPDLWQAAHQELLLLAADPELTPELRGIVERGLAD